MAALTIDVLLGAPVAARAAASLGERALTLFAHLHPLVLHLPIGLAVSLAVLELVRRHDDLARVRTTLAALLALSAAFAASSGLALGSSEDPSDTLFWHKWSALTFASATLLLAFAAWRAPRAYRALLALCLALLIPAGHLGASVTHGENWLTGPLRALLHGEPPAAEGEPADAAGALGDVPAEVAAAAGDVAGTASEVAAAAGEVGAAAGEVGTTAGEAAGAGHGSGNGTPAAARAPAAPTAPGTPLADDGGAPGAPPPVAPVAADYEHVIAPIFAARCGACHGVTRQRSGLDLHTPTGIAAGGKHGKALIAGKPDDSELLRRMRLPLADDDHMPPPAKPQPGEREIEAMAAWIGAGAPFTGAVPALAPYLDLPVLHAPAGG